MGNVKKALKFSLAMVPAAVAAGLCFWMYQLDLFTEEQLAPILEWAGGRGALVLIGTGQTLCAVLLASFFGYLLARAVGLWRERSLEPTGVARCLTASVLCGLLCSLDFWVFGYFLEAVRDSAVPGLTVGGVAAAVLYGGVVEELLMRLFLLSLIVFLLWKLFFRKRPRERIPKGVFIAANVLSALFFAVGHLPADILLFGGLTPLVVVRGLLLHGGFGLLFGRIYCKYGLRCAMLSHITLHLVSKLVWGLLV